MANVVVSIKPTSSTGATGLTRYIAESKRNPEKEGLGEKEPRPLFSYTEDKLTYVEANRILQIPTDTQAQKEDVIHMVISPETGNYEALGHTRQERYDAFREIIRDAVKVIEKEVNFAELYWIAGIHLNTDIPHAHLAICRDGLNKLNNRRDRIKHLPRALIPHHSKVASDEKEFIPGKIAEAVSNGIERQRQLVSERLQKTVSYDHEKSSTDIPNHEKTTRDTPSPENPDRQPRVGQDAIRNSDIELTHEQPERDLIHAPIETPITVHEPTTLHGIQSTTTDRTVDISSHVERDDQHDPISSTQQDRPVTLSAHSGDQGHPTSVERTPTDDDFQKPLHISESGWRERFILGRSMVARAEVDRLRSDLNSTRQHGDKRRFRVYDETHGYTRQISEFDIRRRADAHASATLRQAHELNREQRQQLRQTRYDSEIQRHAKGIGDHQIIVSKTIHKLETQLAAAEEEHAEFRPHAQQIQLRCQAEHTPLPTPLLRHTELNKLQDQTIANRNPARVRTLEDIRESLATERGEPTRSDKDIARLDGHLLVARSEQAARQERAHQFERTRHQTRWEINQKKYSLVDLDRRISEHEKRSRIFGTPLKLTTLHLSPSRRREAAAQVTELRLIRQVVVENIENRRQELLTAVTDAGRMTATLSDIHLKEHDHLLKRNGVRHEKILSRAEIAQLIDHGTLLSDPAMLKHAFILEARYEERLPDDKRPSLTTRAARAIGRETLSEIALQQAIGKLDSFNAHKQFTAVPVKDLQGDEQTARLIDFRRPRHPLIWLAHRLTESKEHAHLRTETTKAIDTEHERLKEEVTRANHCHALTKSMADFHREQLQSFNQPIPEPAFNPKQVIQLELYAARHPDPSERMRLETLVHRADIAAYSHSTQKPKTVEPPLSRSTPGEPLHRNEVIRTAEQQAVDRQPIKEAFHLSEPNHSSQTSAPKTDRQPTAATPSQAEPVREIPQIDDLLH